MKYCARRGMSSRLEVPVGGGDDPDINGAGPGAAYALEMALLKNREDLGLQGKGQFTDLIQKDGSAVSHLETADPGSASACKGP
jgi:hypothetical protein